MSKALPFLSDRDTLLSFWRACHDLSLFFDNFPSWLEVHPEEYNGTEKTGLRELLWEYDDLFKGTNYKIYVPLWASACKDRGEIIQDATTLEVIKACHAWGYAPVPMDGNPPDFIGQQFRFFCYLCAA
jgi:anaerobic dimethyl sulfoxide reductase subunit A